VRTQRLILPLCTSNYRLQRTAGPVTSSAPLSLSIKEAVDGIACLRVRVMICLALAAPAWTQTQITTGVIQGTVADPTGALLPGVSVEIKNVETNLTAPHTDTNGHFAVLQLPRAATASRCRSRASKRCGRKTCC